MGTVVKKEHPYYSNILFTILIFGIPLALLSSTFSNRIDYYSRRKLQVYFSFFRNFNKLFLKLFKFLFSCFFRYVGRSWTDRSTFVFKNGKSRGKCYVEAGRRKNQRVKSFLAYSISSWRTIAFRDTRQGGKKKKASLGCRRCKITVEKKLLLRLGGIYSGIPVTYRSRSFHAMSMVGKLRWPWESQSIGKTSRAERSNSPLWYIRDRSFASRESNLTHACNLYANFTKESFQGTICLLIPLSRGKTKNYFPNLFHENSN